MVYSYDSHCQLPNFSWRLPGESATSPCRVLAGKIIGSGPIAKAVYGERYRMIARAKNSDFIFAGGTGTNVVGGRMRVIGSLTNRGRLERPVQWVNVQFHSPIRQLYPVYLAANET